MNGGVGQCFVAFTNRNSLPLCFGARIVNVGQLGAIAEGVGFNGGDTAGQGDRGQIGATVKSTGADLLNARREGD